MRWEVLTMRSATSFFDKTLLRTDVRRFWPLLFLYTAVWVVMIPVVQWAEAGYMMSGTNRFVGDYFYDMMVAGVFMALVFGFLFAAALFSYLMSSRSVGLMHSLPATRSQQFYSHILAGMGMMTAGKLVTALLSLLVQALLYKQVAWAAMGQWLLVCTVMELFFFALSALCCMATGWLPAVPVLYAAANSFVFLATMLLRALGGIFYFGYISNGGSFPTITRWGTPVYHLGTVLGDAVRLYPEGQTVSQTMAGTEVVMEYTTRGPRIFNPEAVTPLVVYGVLALVILVLTCALYRSRKSETAGDPVAFAWARPIIRGGITFYGGLSFGLGLFSIFRNYNEYLPSYVLMLSVVLAAAVWYFAADMVIRKTFHVFRKGWKGAAVMCALLLAVCIAAKLDITGYVSRVPDADNVKAVEVHLTYDGIYQEYVERETIEAAIALHEAILAEGREKYVSNSWYNVRLDYTLRDGSTLCRYYSLDRVSSRENSVYDAAEALLRTDEARYYTVLGRKNDTPVKFEDIRGGYINCYTDGNRSIQLTAEQARTIYQALLDDIAAGAGAIKPMDDDRLEAKIGIEIDADTNGVWTDNLPGDCTKTFAVLQGLGLEMEDIFYPTEQWVKENGYTDTMTYPVEDDLFVLYN